MERRFYILPGEVPSQKNGQSFNRFSKTVYKSDRFRVWQERAIPELVRQGVPVKPIEYAHIRITFRHDSLKARDGDNQLASVQDLLKKVGVIRDDRWTLIGTPEVVHEVAPFPECVILVEEIAPIDWTRKLKEAKLRK